MLRGLQPEDYKAFSVPFLPAPLYSHTHRKHGISNTARGFKLRLGKHIRCSLPEWMEIGL